MEKTANILKTVLLTTLLSTGFHCNAQYKKDSLELQVDSLTTALRRQGVDTICVYRSYCVGCRGGRIADNSPCAPKGFLIPTYIFWKSHARTCVAYRDNCTRRATVGVSKNLFWDYLTNHKAEIKKGEIKAFTVVDKKVDNGMPHSWTRDHGMHYSYVFYIQNDTVHHYINAFDVQREKKFQKKKSRNVYYKQNTSSPIWKVVKQLEEAVLEAENKGFPARY